MANVFSQSHRAATHLVSAVGNLTEALDIVSSAAIPMAQLQLIESQAELAEKEAAVYVKYPHLKPAVKQAS